MMLVRLSQPQPHGKQGRLARRHAPQQPASENGQHGREGESFHGKQEFYKKVSCQRFSIKRWQPFLL